MSVDEPLEGKETTPAVEPVEAAGNEGLSPGGEGSALEAPEAGEVDSAIAESSAEQPIEALASEIEEPTGDGAGRANLLPRLEEIERQLAEQLSLRKRDQEQRSVDQDRIRQLHEEVQELRKGEVREIKREPLAAMVRQLDFLDEMLAERDESDLAFLRDGVRDALAGSGLVCFKAEPGSAYEKGEHRAVGRVPVHDASLDRTVAKMMRAGFRWNDGVIFREAEVKVNVYDASAAAGEQATDSNDDDKEELDD